MTVNELAERLELEIVYLSDGHREVTGGYTGDLLSWVMGRAQSGDCWITIMSNINVAAVAQLTDVACVVFSEGVIPDEDVIDAAKKHDINMFSSRKTSYALCAELGKAL